MRQHAAKKIVRRIEAKPAVSLKYSHDQLRTAYRKAGVGHIPLEVQQARSQAWLNREQLKQRCSTAGLAAVVSTVTTEEITAPDDLTPEEMEEAARQVFVLVKLTARKVPELKALCKDREITGYSKLNKDGLIEALLAE